MPLNAAWNPRRLGRGGCQISVYLVELQALAAIGYSQSDINDYYEEYFPKKTLSMKI